MGKSISVSEKDEQIFNTFINKWVYDSQGIKKSFIRIQQALVANQGTLLHFHLRPGVSYSLRATVKQRLEGPRPYYAVVDVVDQADGEPWLSVCFYSDTVSDPRDLGNLIPNGLLDEDGYCFPA